MKTLLASLILMVYCSSAYSRIPMGWSANKANKYAWQDSVITHAPRYHTLDTSTTESYWNSLWRSEPDTNDVFATAGNLRSIPCTYLTPGEVLESGGTEDFRYCTINLSTNREHTTSYLVHSIFIGYSTNTIVRTIWVVMPICVMSQIAVFNNGNRTMYMVDTLTEGHWVKRLYRRTCN